MYKICPSSAASERVWNVYGTIHTKKRNRPLSSKCEKLAFVYINTALIDKQDIYVLIFIQKNFFLKKKFGDSVTSPVTSRVTSPVTKILGDVT